MGLALAPVWFALAWLVTLGMGVYPCLLYAILVFTGPVLPVAGVHPHSSSGCALPAAGVFTRSVAAIPCVFVMRRLIERPAPILWVPTPWMATTYLEVHALAVACAGRIGADPPRWVGVFPVGVLR